MMVLNPLEYKVDSEIRRLLKIRKSKKRRFIRHMAWRWVKLEEKWRYPNGRDNKLRLQYKGYPPKVKVGYRSPRKTRHLHPSGQIETLVRNIKDLFHVDPLTQVVRISGNVGGRKRLEIIKFAEKFGIRVLNPGKIPVLTAPARETTLTREEIRELETELAPETEIEKELEKELEKIEEKTEKDISTQADITDIEKALEEELEKKGVKE